jgi:hypothetical protein
MIHPLCTKGLDQKFLKSISIAFIVPFKVCFLKGDSFSLEQLESFHHTDKVIGSSIWLDFAGVSTNKAPGFILFNWFRSTTKEDNVLAVIYVF